MIPETGTINPGWFSLALRGQLALGTVCAPRSVGFPLRAHLRVSSHMVDVELLFTVLKLLWAIGVSKAERRLARRDTAIAGDVPQERGRQGLTGMPATAHAAPPRAIKTPLPPSFPPAPGGGCPHLLIHTRHPVPDRQGALTTLIQ